ncbi:MAG: hypothetical protein IJ728_10835 [Selenomonadaceae bacterium]|nr:hypothetical protein [Selenomonadaceae bacterium]
MEMTKAKTISISFSTSDSVGVYSFVNSYDVESDCTQSQIVTFADVCASIVGADVESIIINEETTLQFGTN